MKRNREQKGYLFKRSGVWYVRHHDNRIEGDQLVRKQVSTRIGLIEDFPSKADARDEAHRILAPINEASHKPAVVQPLVQFADREFFPFIRGQVRPSTANGYEAGGGRLSLGRLISASAIPRRPMFSKSLPPFTN